MALIRSLHVVCLLSLIWQAVALTPANWHMLKTNSVKNKLNKALQARDTNPSLLYPAHTLSVPVDHFHTEAQYAPHLNATFELRYWFDASHYQTGGPVIILQGGETSGTDRLPYLQKGILAQLAQATHGIGVVLEHRYYGESIPTPDLSVASLRFLTVEQALADEAYFAQHVQFPGLGGYLPETNGILSYGGSYAGGFSGFLRVAYPDIFVGSIASSGVTEAIWDYWQYMEPIRTYGPTSCIANVQKTINIVDNIILNVKDENTTYKLKELFGLQDVVHIQDFANFLSYPFGGWQELNWDPAVTDTSFYQFCDVITNSTLGFPALANQSVIAEELIKVGGWGNESSTLLTPLLNYVGYIQGAYHDQCGATATAADADSCLTSFDAAEYSADDKTQTWRSWPYQYCTQFGYLITGSGVPKDQLPLVSRTVDTEYLSQICEYAFNLTKPADTAGINKRYGGYAINASRLAIVDGEHDPWRPATPHASPFAAAGVRNRTSTPDNPFVLIAGAVHHWDENGLFANQTTATLPPGPVADTQRLEVQTVLRWLEEWRAEQKGKNGGYEVVKGSSSSSSSENGVVADDDDGI